MARSVAPGQVVGRPGGGLAEDQDLRRPAPQADGQRVEQVALGVEVALVDRQLLGDPEGPPGGQDGDLGHRVGVLGQEGHQGVARLVDGHRVLLLGEEGVGGVPPTEDDPVPGLVDVAGEDDVPVVADGHDGRLVDEVGQVGPREPGRGPGHGIEVDVWCRGACPRRARPGWPPARPGWAGGSPPRGRSGPGRSRAGSRTSGRLVAAMTTTPVVGSKPSISASSWLRVCSRSSLETIDPPRRWPMASISSMKMIEGARLRASANRSRTREAPTPTNSSTKLDPVRARKGTSGLTGHRPGHQGLARARRAHHEHAPGADGPGPGVALGVAQEVDDLGHLPLGPLVAGDVGEPGRGPVLVVDLGLGPSDAHDPARPAARRVLRPIQMKKPMNNRKGRKDRRSARRARTRPHPGDGHVVGLQGRGQWSSLMAVGIWLV